MSLFVLNLFKFQLPFRKVFLNLDELKERVVDGIGFQLYRDPIQFEFNPICKGEWISIFFNSNFLRSVEILYSLYCN